MRVVVCGGRDFTDRAFVFRILDLMNQMMAITEVIHGDARGADRLGGEWGEARGIPVTPVPAKWKQHGPAAGPLRNQEMLDLGPDMVIAFPGGTGTQDMVDRALQAGKQVARFSPAGMTVATMPPCSSPSSSPPTQSGESPS